MVNEINVRTGINNLGYGKCGQNICKFLHKRGIKVNLFPIGGVELGGEEDVPAFQQMLANQHTFAYDAPSLCIWHENQLAESIGRGKRVGISFFERNKLDKVRVHHLNSLDLILSPSKWAENVMKESGVVAPIEVCPMGADPSTFFPSKTKYNEFVVFHCAKIELRKGSDLLIQLFNRAFSPNDNVKLKISWQNPFLEEKEHREWDTFALNSEMGRAGKIELLQRFNTDKELADIMRQCHVGFFPTKSEGFGLPILESLSCGLQVVTTNYSAQTEFCNENNCHLIEIDELEPAYDGKWFFGEFEFAKFGERQEEQAISHLRNLYQKWKDGQDLTNCGGLATAKEFTWENTVNTIIRYL